MNSRSDPHLPGVDDGVPAENRHLFENQNLLDAVLKRTVRSGQTGKAASDDHYVVGFLPSNRIVPIRRGGLRTRKGSQQSGQTRGFEHRSARHVARATFFGSSHGISFS